MQPMGEGARAPRKHSYRPAALVFLLSLCLSVAAFIATRTSEQRRQQSEFKELAARPPVAVQESISFYLEEIKSIGKFYASSHFVERAEFQAFTQGILSRWQAINALEWVPRVAAADRTTFEADARAEISSDFWILELDEQGQPVPAARRRIYFPVWYVEPFPPNEKALGLDLGASPRYREALNKARTGRLMAATRPLALASGDRPQSGVAVFLPIYHGDILHGEPLGPKEQLYGLVVGVFRIGDLVDEALAKVSPNGIEARVYDEEVAPSSQLLHTYPPLPETERDTAAAGGDRRPPSGLVYTQELEIADRRWVMECTPTADYLAATRSWAPPAVLAIGLLFTCLLTAYVVSVLGRAAWAGQLVAERTAELSQANQRLHTEIAERRRAEDALKARNRELESFVYTASHDLRTPLVSIEGFAKLLEDDHSDRLDPEGKEYLWRVRANAANMDALLTDLLELSRVTSTGEPTESLSVAEVVAQALQELSQVIKRSQAEVVVPEDLPTVCASPTRLRQVFTNLIANAVKFSREGVPPRIQIRWEKLPHGYRFLVKDNGIGIPEKYRERVFELFSRLKDKDVPGTGVGLAIVKRIIDDHGGEVGADSTPGEGSTLWFTLPPCPEAAATVTRETTPKQESSQ